MRRFLKISYIILFSLTLFFSKALAATTYVDAFSIRVTGSSAANEDRTHGLTFSSDGTRVYVIGHKRDRVFQYLLDTPWDISSITSGLNGELHIVTAGTDSSNVSDPRDIKFNTDGTKLFVLDRVVARVYEWSLATAWDVTTGSYTDGNFFDVDDIDSKSNSFTFSLDGTKMFILAHETTGTVYQHSLTTGFDITTAAYTGKSVVISTEEGTPEGLEFSRDGTQMFVVGHANASIFQYLLTTPWDIETVSYTSGDSYSVTSEDGLPEEIEFSSDGSKLFVLGRANSQIFEYTLSCYYGVVNCIDPTSDKDDVASVEAQTESAKQLIQHTTYPVLNRMEWLRRNNNNSNLTNQNIKFQFSNEILASLLDVGSIKLDNALLNYWIKKLPDKLVAVNGAVENGQSITIGREYKKKIKIVTT